jgi:RecA/RadA recombinase
MGYMFMSIYDIDGIFDEEEKSSKLNAISIGSSLDTTGALSTGQLAIDLIIGGGLLPGSWVEVVGPESGGKTTSMYASFAQALTTIPNSIKGLLLDVEGVLDYQWFSNISGVKDLENVFGRRDPDSGKWEKKPNVRYYKPAFGEMGLRFIKQTLKRMPDKVKIKDQWFYVFVPNTTKAGKKIDPEGGTKKLQQRFKGKYNKKLWSKTGCFYIPVPDNYPGVELLIGIDSLASMTPESTAEDDSNAIGQHARMFGKYCNDIKALISKKGATMFAVNQIREKPMCLMYESQVLLSDGTTRKIGEIVRDKLETEVVSYNFETKKFENKKITNWFNNGVAKEGEFKAFKIANGSLQGGTVLKATNDHEVFTKEGKVKLGTLKVGDEIYAKVDEIPTGDTLQVILGATLGDGYIKHTETHMGMSRYLVRIKHGLEQESYCREKELILGRDDQGDYGSNYYECNTTIKGSNILRKVYRETYDYSSGELKRRFSKTLERKIDLRGIAIWYMDDGHLTKDGYRIILTVSKYSDKDVYRLADMLYAKTGLHFKVNIKYYTKDYKHLTITNKADVQRFLDLVAPYMLSPKIFEYKLGGLKIKESFTYNWKYSSTSKLRLCKIVEIRDIKRSTRSNPRYSRYCIEVDGNHNFVSDGLLVKNSWGDPEYSPGGNTLKHVTDCRLRYGAISNPHGKGQVHFEGDDEYRYGKAKTKKNKLFIPFRESIFRWWIGHEGKSGFGVDPVMDTFSYLESTAQIEKSKGKFTILMPTLQGEEFTWETFKENILHEKKKKQNIRLKCFRQMKSGRGMKKYIKALS